VLVWKNVDERDLGRVKKLGMRGGLETMSLSRVGVALRVPPWAIKGERAP